MPRKSSANRKYLVFLSRADSSLWSQRLGGGRRKPGCGGPAGRAARRTEDEKFAVDPRGRKAEGIKVGRAEATSFMTELEEAIMKPERSSRISRTRVGRDNGTQRKRRKRGSNEVGWVGFGLCH